MNVRPSRSIARRAAISQTATMTGRELRHALTYPGMTVSAVAVPVVMLLLFVYVLGRPLDAGLGATAHGRYVDYLLPGSLVMAVAAGTAAISVNVCTDMTQGIVDRFRTMAVARSAFLSGHVAAGLLRTFATLAAVIGVALAIGARPDGGVAGVAGTVAILTVFAMAMMWLAVALGSSAATVEGANGATLPLQFVLPFLSSTFVPVDTMPTGLRWFAEHQPFTYVAEAARGTLVGDPSASTIAAAVAWSVLIACVAAWRAVRRYDAGPRTAVTR